MFAIFTSILIYSLPILVKNQYLILFLFFSFLTLNSVNLFAQREEIDSLKLVLKKVDNEEKALILAKLSTLYYKEPEKRFSYAQQAIKLADSLDNPIAKSLALYSLSHYYLVKNNPSKAEEFADSNIVVALASGDSSSLSNAYYFYGFYYSSLADYNNAAVYYKKALEYTPFVNKERKYSLMQSYAITLNNLSNYEEALKMLLKVVDYYEKTKNQRSVAHIYYVLGAIFVEMGDNESAKAYFHRALKLARQSNYDFVIGETMFGLGSLYSDEKMIDSARYYLLNAKKYVEKDRFYSLIADLNTALGDLYLNINNTDSALFYYNEVIRLSEKINDNWAIVYGYIGLAKVYNKEQNYGRSLFYLYKVEPIAQKVNANELLIDFYDIFAQTLALSGNYREAYHYMKLYNQYSDKFYKEKSAHELTNLKVAYETEKKEQENQQLLAENKFKEQNIKNQHYISISIALLLILALSFAFSFFRGKRKVQKAHELLVEKNKEILNQNEEIKTKSAEISEAYSKLKELDEYKQGLSNMIIHDLKNPLNIILNLAENKLVKEAANKMFHLVSDILDVSKLEEAKMVLNKEKLLLKDIVHNAINKTEFSAGISEIEVIDNVADGLSIYADKDLTERVFINLLSNAIKFSPQKSKIFIDTKVKENGNKVRISVTDFGIGIPKEEQKHIFDKFVQFKAVNSATVRSTGLGLTFCKLAVEAQGGEIGVESSINTGSVFWFDLPFAG